MPKPQGPAPKPASRTDELLRAAIDQRRLVEPIYKDNRRIVEPHDYGVHNGSIKLLGYQIGGSSSGRLPNWRWIEANLISDVRLLKQTFAGGRPNRSGKHHQWDQLFIRVRPAEQEEE
jgi:hypothetical protein